MRPEDGFRIAVTVTSFGDLSEIEDPSIGTVEFYLKSWTDEVNADPLTFKKLKTRTCDRKLDFGDGADNEGKSFFNPLHSKSTSYQGYIKKMKCVDEPFEIFGDYNTNVASNLMVTFVKCDPQLRQCADDATIIEWMKFKYLVIMENDENYLQTKPDGERIQKFAKVNFFALSTTSRLDQIKYITFNDIELEKYPIGIQIEDYNTET